MPPASPPLSLHERVRIYAEARLGRPLTAAEEHIDIIGADAAMEAAKRALHRAVAREQGRYSRSAARGHTDRMQVTPGMYRALTGIWKAGKEGAEEEMRSMGVVPYPEPRAYDEFDRLAVLGVLRDGLDAEMLAQVQALQVKVDRVGAEASLQGLAFTAVARKMAQVPGALNVASQMISGAYNGGLAFTYENNQDLFTGWQYTAVMDASTCEFCALYDGQVWQSLDDAYVVMPNFGPNPSCLGRGRCRCRLVPLPPAFDALPVERRTLPPTPEEVAATQIDYQNQLAFRLNGKLRAGTPLDAAEARAVEVLDSQFVPAPEKTILWRGLPDYEELFPGGILPRAGEQIGPFKGYTSTSIDWREAEVFAVDTFGEKPTLLRIELPEGSAMQRLEADEAMSQQKEVLLPRGMEFNVQGFTTRPDGVIVIHLRALKIAPGPRL